MTNFKKAIQKCLNEKCSEVMPLNLFGFVKITLPECDDKKTVCDDLVNMTKEYWLDRIGDCTQMTCGLEHYHSRATEGNIGEECDTHLHIHFHWDTKVNPIDTNVTVKVMENKYKAYLCNWVTQWKSKVKKTREYDFTRKKGMISVKWASEDASAIDCMKYPLKQYDYLKNSDFSYISDNNYIGYTEIEYCVLRDSASDWWRNTLHLFTKKKKYANEIKLVTFWEDCKIWLKENSYSTNVRDERTICLGILRFHALKSRDISLRDIKKKYNLWRCQECEGDDEKMAVEIMNLIV